MILQHCHVSFRVLLVSKTLGVSAWQTQRYHGLLCDGWKGRLHFVSFGFLREWHGFSQSGWRLDILQAPAKVRYLLLELSWDHVWKSISFCWSSCCIIPKIPNFEVKMGSKCLSIHLISVLQKKSSRKPAVQIGDELLTFLSQSIPILQSLTWLHITSLVYLMFWEITIWQFSRYGV